MADGIFSVLEVGQVLKTRLTYLEMKSSNIKNKTKKHQKADGQQSNQLVVPVVCLLAGTQVCLLETMLPLIPV